MTKDAAKAAQQAAQKKLDALPKDASDKAYRAANQAVIDTSAALPWWKR